MEIIGNIWAAQLQKYGIDIRELEEETGYRAGKLEKLLSLKSTVAFCDEFIDVYLATELEKVGEQHLDESEEIDIEEWDLKDLMDMCYRGELQDSKTVAAIMAYAAKGSF